ncbi:RICIN domain-containing protein [Kitasatospora cineracea]|uniref:O-glycosyl hydrolase n=1 Tax=Kitasatospora cineracea TaxID=88074 RepID=A0A3N4R5W5_9ACTN|nr:RICIN domain-containing protein [Kitasatospora cineracea]RPE28552.1 O-glycosyl hydrolase [Kitasatospora cineracea]
MSPQRRTTRSARAAALTALAALAAGTLTAPPAAAEEAAAHVTVRLDPSYQQQPFQGWGTALAWFANATGDWPDAKRNELADALYGANGLGFTVARYNIGGGDSPETAPYLRPGAAVPGYWNRPAAYGPPGGDTTGWTEQPNWWDPGDPDDWNPQADAAQRWWLTAAKSRGADTFEAFSNSAPYFMTDSGLVSGAVNGWQDNLRPDQYDRFAAYLAGSLRRAQAATGVTFDSLSPMNEPGTSYWHAGGPQEGSHWDTASQTHLATSVRAALDAAHLTTPLAAMDETNPDLFRDEWNAYPAAARAAVGKLNTHTYSTGGRGTVRDLAKGAGLPDWMSEVDLGGSVPQSFTDMSPALDFAHRITDDVRELEPGAWVMWQAVEDYTNMTPAHENSNWGLVQVDLNSADPANEPLRLNKKYWAMANYSRFVRPGARVIATDSADTLAALRPNGTGAVAVYTNSTGAAQTLTLDLAGFQSVDTSVPVQRWTTDGGKNLVREPDLAATAAKTLTATVGPGSVTTFVLPGATGTAAAAATVPTGRTRLLVNDHSGLALAASGTAVVQHTPNTTDTTQQWNFTRLAGTYDSTAAYRITNAKSGKALSVAGGALSLVSAGSSTQQQWLLSTTGDGHDTLVNKAGGLLLDVSNQSTADGAPVGAWTPTGGGNQSWAIGSAAPDAYKGLKVRLSGRCAEVAGGSTAAGAPVVQHTCANATDQQWTLRPAGGPGQVNVVVRSTGQCLDVTGASTADGAPLVQYPCNGGTNQQWSVRDTGSGYVTLLARHSGKCLDVNGSSTADGAALVQRPCTGAPGQQLLAG